MEIKILVAELHLSTLFRFPNFLLFYLILCELFGEICQQEQTISIANDKNNQLN